jgi:hypothetical protein
MDVKEVEANMVDISPDKVGFIIVKAKEFDVKVDPVGENLGSSDSDDGERDVLEDFANDPNFAELHDFIAALNEEEAWNLVALMWVGRGTFSKEEWGEAVETARLEATNPTPDYLLGTPLLGDYLEEGLNEMGFNVDDYTLNHL